MDKELICDQAPVIDTFHMDILNSVFRGTRHMILLPGLFWAHVESLKEVTLKNTNKWGLSRIRGGKGWKERRVPLSPGISDQLRQDYVAYPQRAISISYCSTRAVDRSLKKTK